VSAPERIDVVIPARNEEEHISTCLSHIRAAVARVRAERPGIDCAVTVVLDSCSDRTAVLAAGFDAHLVAGEFGCVGSARHAGIVAALERADRPPTAVWLANTDADSEVPEDWLVVQADLAADGADAVIGTVTPDGLDPDTDRRWRERQSLSEDHPHVHGANLGIRASAYLAAGGFRDAALHEDQDLVDRLRAVTGQWAATHRISVTTSARRTSRVDGGFATYLADLDAGGSACA
jgi:glycosyltransferase involved in cell wall biosynthesis